MSKSRLHELSEHGVSVWIDSLSRQWLRDGTLDRLIEEDAVVGITSNPTIFQKACRKETGTTSSCEVLREEDDAREIFWQLAVKDVSEALDRLRSIWDGGNGLDGYVSLESTPTSPTTARRRSSRRCACTRLGRPPEPLREDPRDGAGARCDRGVDRARPHNINVTR